MIYTAKLTGNKRDAYTTVPKALFTHIKPSEGLFRDHCWVEITDLIKEIQPKGHQKPITIEFEADLRKYKRRGVEDSYTLTKIRNVIKVKK